MSELVCKAAICSTKAQATSQTLADVNEIIKGEKPKLRIEVAEFIISRNEDTLKKALNLIGNA